MTMPRLVLGQRVNLKGDVAWLSSCRESGYYEGPVRLISKFHNLYLCEVPMEVFIEFSSTRRKNKTP